MNYFIFLVKIIILVIFLTTIISFLMLLLSKEDTILISKYYQKELSVLLCPSKFNLKKNDIFGWV